MPIVIRGEDEETLTKLKEMGFDVQIVSDDPMADLIFYVARMNAKLDNLGQLRHLHKIMQSTLRNRSDSEPIYKFFAMETEERQARMFRLKKLYDGMKDLTDVPENKQWREQLPTFDELVPQNEKDVLRAFHCTIDDLYRVQALEEKLVYYKGITTKDMPAKVSELGAVGQKTNYLRFS